MSEPLNEIVPGKIWSAEYKLRFSGMDLFGRMTIIRLNSGKLFVHSPCEISDSLKAEIDNIGHVSFIVAPGNYHHLYVTDFQKNYPDAETFICPGLEKKRADIRFDWILGNRPDHRWKQELDQVFIQGTKFISEVVFFHRDSKTLILVDLLENIGDDYSHEAGLLLRFWWKVVFKMWNNPKAAPEYQLGWGDKKIVAESLQRVIDWQADRVILAHGKLIEGNVHNVLSTAWEKVLKF